MSHPGLPAHCSGTDGGSMVRLSRILLETGQRLDNYQLRHLRSRLQYHDLAPTDKLKHSVTLLATRLLRRKRPFSPRFCRQVDEYRSWNVTYRRGGRYNHQEFTREISAPLETYQRHATALSFPPPPTVNAVDRLNTARLAGTSGGSTRCCIGCTDVVLFKVTILSALLASTLRIPGMVD